LSPSSTRRRTAGQNPARDLDPHETDDGPDEPRIGAVRGPESTAHPRGAAQHAEHDGCDARPEQRVRDQPSPPEPERPCHDQHRARKRAQHDEDPREVIQSRCERLIDFAWVLVVLSSFPRAMLIMAGSFGLWRARLISNALFGTCVAAVVLGVLGGTTWVSGGFWAPDGAYARFVWPIIGLVWVVVASRVLARSPATRAGW